MDFKSGLKVSSFIIPTSSKDKYPTHIDIFGKGGYRTVENISALNSIPTDRHKDGMLAYVLDENIIYILLNSEWQKLHLPIANMPSLTTNSVTPILPTNIPTDIFKGFFANNEIPLLNGGKIYRGSSDGTVKLTDDLTQLEVNFLAFKTMFYYLRSETNLIGGKPSIFSPYLSRKTQWLSDLDDPNNPDAFYILKSNKGVIAKAIAGSDYFDLLEQQPDEAYLPVISTQGGLDKLLSKSSIKVLEGVVDENGVPIGDNISGINSLNLTTLQAKNTVTSEQNVFAKTSLESRKLILYDAVSRYTKYVGLEAPNAVTNSITWAIPQSGADKQIITLKNNNEWVFSDIEDIDIANKNSTYITRTKDDNLPNSTALKDLVGLLHPNGGLLKIDNNGHPSIASGGSSLLLDDYLTPANYDELDGKIDALGRGVAAAIETQVAVDAVLTIAQLLGFAEKLASNYRLNELRDQTIILSKAGDNENDYGTRYNVIFDNNGNPSNQNWEYGISLLAKDSSLTELSGNDIDPIYFRIGGMSDFIASAQTARFLALGVEFLNDGTKEKKWHPKKFHFVYGKQDYVREDRKGYDTTKGEVLQRIFDYDTINQKLTFHQKTVQTNIESERLTVSASLKIPVYNGTTEPTEEQLPKGCIAFAPNL